MEININNKVYFKFTEHGKALMQKMGEQLAEGMGFHNKMVELYQSEADAILAGEEENGYAEMQLWVFIRWFGKHIYNGAEPIIQDNNFQTEKPY